MEYVDTRRRIYSRFRKLVLDKPYHSGLVIITLAFLLFQSWIAYWSSLSLLATACTVADFAFFLAYCVLFINSGGRPGPRSRTALKALFILSILSFFAVFSISGEVAFYLTIGTLAFLFPILVYSVFIVLLFLMVSVALLVAKGKYRIYAYLFLLFAIASFLISYSAILNAHIVPSDETFVTFYDSKLLLQGMDPYSMNIGNILASNFTAGWVGELTYTTTNQIVGELNYPALFLLVSVPFYFSQLGGINAFGFDTSIEVGFLLVPLFLVLALYPCRDYYKMPILSIAFFTAYAMNQLSSPVELLMLAMIILAYVKLDSRYSWLILGICLSLQELLWFPVILLVIYKMNNSGVRKGLSDAFGAAAIFLLINSYFIAINPSAFIHGISNPLGNIIPEPGGMLGYLIAVAYGTQIGATTYIVGAAMLLAALALLYLNRKRLIPILGLMPFAFLSHSIMVYSGFFIAFFFAAIFIKEKPEGRGGIGGWLEENKAVLYSMLALLLIGSCAFLIYSHQTYSREFGLWVTGKSSYFNATSDSEIYTATLNYRNLSNYTVHVLVFGLPNNNPGFFGLPNTSIIADPENCTGQPYTCQTNINSIHLNPANSTYPLLLTVKLQKNQTMYISEIVVYNKDYAYFSGPT